MIRMPDALAPYASLLKWGLIVALAASLFIGGCQHGKGRQKAKDAEAVKSAQQEAANQRAQVKVLADQLAGISRDTQARAAQAKAEAQRAAQAAGRAALAAKNLRAELDGIERDIARAKRNPTCRQALEQRACAALH